MKNKLLKIFLSLSLVCVATSCSTNTAMNSYGVSGPSIMIDDDYLESDVEIKGRIAGYGTATYLFGFLHLGDTHQVEGVWSRNGVASFIAGLKKDHAKMEATYDALTSSGADMIVEPRYEVVTSRNILWTTVRAKVHGFKGTIISYNQYKQNKPTFMEENFGYPPVEGTTLKVEVEEK